MTTCPECRRSLPDEEFYAGSSARCKRCTTWRNLQYNARKEGHTLGLTEEGFLTWYGASKQRSCSYCGISEASFTSLKRKNPHGFDIQCLGVDRCDSSGGYTTDNIRLACFICNRVKSDIFMVDEMDVVGRAVRDVWKTRGLR